MRTTIKNFSHAQEFLYKHIPEKSAKRFPGILGLKRMRYFLKLLDNPQNKLKVIHIAGTSGKGSTAYLTSLLLGSLGFKTGLHTSPHLVDIRERFQIGGQMISKVDFCKYLYEIIPAIEKVKQSNYKELTYFEILVALAFYIFWKEKVDYAVMETGMGGLYDATNTITQHDKLVLLTKIGFDHTEILGDTINQIAYQKAMIIKNANYVLSVDQWAEAKKIIDEVSRLNNATVSYIKTKINYSRIKLSQENSIFDFQFSHLRLKKLQLGLLGQHQAQNASLALAAVYYLSRRDGFRVEVDEVRTALKLARLPGRMEIFIKRGKTLVLDGAHNPQKMQAFLFSLKKIFPNIKFHFLVAFKNDKNYAKMLKQIIPIADKITVTSFSLKQDLLPKSEQSDLIGNILIKNKFNNFQLVDDPQRALKEVIKDRNNFVVITGSIYLLAVLYKYIVTVMHKP